MTTPHSLVSSWKYVLVQAQISTWLRLGYVLIKAPPFSGKTALLTQLYGYIQTNEFNTSVFYVSFAQADLTSNQIIENVSGRRLADWAKSEFCSIR